MAMRTVRYAALLRGIMPAGGPRMTELKQAFESAGFTDVRTVLSSGNVVFTAPAASEASLRRRADDAMTKHLGRSFLTIVRPVAALREMLASDPYGAFLQCAGEKRVVTFLRDRPRAGLRLPFELDGVRILRIVGRDVFSAYVRNPKGAIFMTLLNRTFGKEQTTRTWDTVAKITRW